MGKGSRPDKLKSGKGKKLLGNSDSRVFREDARKKAGGKIHSSFTAADLEALINRF